MVLPAILESGYGSIDTIALARFEHRSGRGSADQGGPHQHGAFARGQAAVAGSPAGRIHVDRTSGNARRPAQAPRQVAGAPAHGAAAAAGTLGAPEVGLWFTRASLAQAPPARTARCRRASPGAGRV